VQRTELDVRAADGRLVKVEVVGPRDGIPVFYFHGTPGSRWLYEGVLKAAVERDVFHICHSRPGFEGSDRQPGRVAADSAADVAAIADALGIETFYAVSESGGGPHALGCAAQLEGRVRRVAIGASPAPITADGFDWWKGMAKSNRDEFAAAIAGTDAYLRYLEPKVAAIRAARTWEELLEALGDVVGPADRAYFEANPDFADYALQCWKRIVAGKGVWGWIDDGIVLVNDWGFELSRVVVPVAVWQGGLDKAVPPADGLWLANHLPNAKLHPLPDDGHNLMDRYGEILDALISKDDAS
jgi:pimeloyl-ACP methyl ester carboxylesterase